MKKTNYFNSKEFIGLYLEDSYVLQIIEMPKLVSFHMEFVLTEDHPLYRHPLENEMYCYKYGVINFIEPVQVLWNQRNQKVYSIGEYRHLDLGNIDFFYKSGDEYLVEGDWGNVLISCSDVEIKLIEDREEISSFFVNT